MRERRQPVAQALTSTRELRQLSFLLDETSARRPHSALHPALAILGERCDPAALDVPKRLSPDQIEALALATCGFEAEGDEFEIVVGGCALKVGEMVRQRHGESYAWHLRTS